MATIDHVESIILLKSKYVRLLTSILLSRFVFGYYIVAARTKRQRNARCLNDSLSQLVYGGRVKSI